LTKKNQNNKNKTNKLLAIKTMRKISNAEIYTPEARSEIRSNPQKSNRSFQLGDQE
jgi:hypothetical protein